MKGKTKYTIYISIAFNLQLQSLLMFIKLRCSNLMNTTDTSVLWGYVLLILAINILHNVYCVKSLDKHILLLILNSH